MKYGLVVAALLLVWSGVAHAYTVTVNSFTDDVAAGGSCSVREALVPASAVANGCVLEGSADEPYVVLLPPGSYDIDVGSLTVNNAVLRGTGPRSSVLWARFDAADPLIALSGTTELQHLTLARATKIDGVTGVYASGTASLVDVEIRGFLTQNETQANAIGAAVGHGPGASVSIRGGRIADCNGFGYAIMGFGAVSIDGVLFEDNGASRGVVAGTSIKVTRSVLRHNAHGDGTALLSATDVLEVRDSLFDGNVVRGTALVRKTAAGAGYVVNSTFVDNVSSNRIFDGELIVESVTAVRNQTGGFVANSATVTARSSVIAENSPADLGAVTSGGFNIIGTGTMTPLPSDHVGIDPGLLPFDGRIVPLSADSPARDSGDCSSLALGALNTTDQVGAARPFGAACDAGAAEYRPTPLLLAVTAAAAGVCESEGWLLTAGRDNDSSGVLEASEVQATAAPICAAVCATCETCVVCPEPEEAPSVCDEPLGAASLDDGCNATAQGLSLWPVALLVLTASMRRRSLRHVGGGL